MGKKKKILKAIESFNKTIMEHKRKIKEYEGKKEHLVPYWAKEIGKLEEGKKKKVEKLRE